MKAKWIEGRFTSSALNLGVVTLSVSWATVRPSGYVWSASGGASDDKRYVTMRGAQEAAEAWARKALTFAINKLPEADS